ncbi:hypothetical protein [Brucella intermedia]|uniref:Alkyl hydroperoxide reductase subunit AhpF n=1 Tax=Brucella intermedia TaxID=94625 RepID=A0ABR6AKW2_9HYPH|nr:hypothetical protein [Brucella intermedia]KAB2711974.1 hypothetical protein F9K80_05205 [Brucella intermedia]MBA8850095.1 alkyl hydroperoxide reductase subunit AhpF [Brucella intermedia]NYD80873.1 alkyl hydroperoxide reductase subunit AhpF [Brucella intermedia]WGG60424.1 hypothetical protein QA414_05805 [Brucella intermedia]
MTSQAHALQQLALARDRDPVFNFSFERSDEPVAFTGLIEGEILSLVKALTQVSEKAFKKDEGEIFENLHDFPISG